MIKNIAQKGIVVAMMTVIALDAFGSMGAIAKNASDTREK